MISKACPKCGGDLYSEEEHMGLKTIVQLKCLQCGFTKAPDKPLKFQQFCYLYTGKNWDDRVLETRDRNLRIKAKLRDGVDIVDIAKEYGLKRNTVRIIGQRGHS